MFWRNAPHTQARSWGEQLRCCCFARLAAAAAGTACVQLLPKRSRGMAQRPTSSSTAISSLVYPIVLSALLHSSLSSVRDTNEVLAGPAAAAAALLLAAAAAAPALLLMLLLLLTCAECMLLIVPLGVGELLARVGGAAAAAAGPCPAVQKGTRTGPRWPQIGVRVTAGRFGANKLRIVCECGKNCRRRDVCPGYAHMQAMRAALCRQTQRVRERNGDTSKDVRDSPLQQRKGPRRV